MRNHMLHTLAACPDMFWQPVLTRFLAAQYQFELAAGVITPSGILKLLFSDKQFPCA